MPVSSCGVFRHDSDHDGAAGHVPRRQHSAALPGAVASRLACRKQAGWHERRSASIAVAYQQPTTRSWFLTCSFAAQAVR